MSEAMDGALHAGNVVFMADYQASHFLWSIAGKVATITLNRPDKKNPAYLR
jgi:hypothetical protein